MTLTYVTSKIEKNRVKVGLEPIFFKSFTADNIIQFNTQDEVAESCVIATTYVTQNTSCQAFHEIELKEK